jgi:hypothetical protein
MEKTYKTLRLALLALAIANEIIKLRTNLRKAALPGAMLLTDVEPDAETSAAFDRAFDRAAEAVTKQARERGQQ